LESIRNLYQKKGFSIEIYDLRPYWSPGKHFNSLLKPLKGDPQGSVTIDLGDRSLFRDRPTKNIYGACYDRRETRKFHDGKRNAYQLSKTIMDADVVISVPKLKVHKKVGVTLNVKNLVGISTNKNCLAHYALSSPKRGGDQYPDEFFSRSERMLIELERWMYDHLLMPKNRFLEKVHHGIYDFHNRFTKKFISVPQWKRRLDAGNWHGNDTAWRMAIDLFNAFNSKPHRTFTIIDGIVGGDREGPLNPRPKFSMTLIGSLDWIAADVVATRLMGFDPMKIPTYRHLFENGRWHSNAITISSNDPSWNGCLKNSMDKYLKFEPHPGWMGHIEI
jgi:uncharacterized protein (DUF362 family)